MCAKSCATVRPMPEAIRKRLPAFRRSNCLNFSDGNFEDLPKLEEHFGNLLEPRLYDQAHGDYLERLAKLHCAIEAASCRRSRGAEITPPDPRPPDCNFEDHELWHGMAFIDRGRMLHELRGAFRPLMMSEPDTVQKLTSLAHQIENRSAPSAKWLRDARTVRDMLTEEAWLDHLRRITAVTATPDFGVPGETYLRTVIYLAACCGPRMSALSSPTMRSGNAT